MNKCSDLGGSCRGCQDLVARPHVVDEGVEDVGDVLHGGHVQDGQGVGVLGVVGPHQGQRVLQEVATPGPFICRHATVWSLTHSVGSGFFLNIGRRKN